MSQRTSNTTRMKQFTENNQINNTYLHF